MKKYLLPFLSILLISFTLAQSSFQQFTGEEGLEIEYQKFEYFKVGENFTVYAHVFNLSNGIPMDNSTTDCYFHAYSSNGSRIIDGEMNWSDPFSWTFDIPAEVFTQGKFSWVVQCNTSSLGGFISGYSIVTHTGSEPYLEQTLIDMFLPIFFVLLFVGLFYLTKNINFDKWYSGILKKYEEKNFVKMVLSGIGYNIMKNTFVLYYIIGFPIILSLTNLATTYNIVALIDLMKVLMYIYASGFLLVGVMFLGYVQEWIIDLKEKAEKTLWGMLDE